MAEGFVAGVQEGEGLVFIFGFEAGLLAGRGVFAVINTGPAKQDETCFHVAA